MGRRGNQIGRLRGKLDYYSCPHKTEPWKSPASEITWMKFQTLSNLT